MAYNPATDFLALWRNIAGQVSKVEIPGLDYVLAALARAGLITLSVGATAPVANQSTTAWLQAAVPSNSAEGALFLWDKVTTAYLPATAGLLLQMLEASAGENGVSWWTTVGAPSNILGNNGDFAIRTDEPGGIYGPKALGAWPVTPIAGTTDIVGSVQLDQSFGTAEGALIMRGPSIWQALPIGLPNSIAVSSGLLPQWETLTALLDAVFGGVQGSILYRSATNWTELPPGVANQVLSTNGPAANPAWSARTPEFPSGTVMIFQQATAPTGWTRQTLLNDYGLRVVSGGPLTTQSGTAFSTVFAQTSVGNTALTAAQIPSHTHGYQVSVAGPQKPNGSGSSPSDGTTGATTDGGTGGGQAHTHTISLQLSYTDVIIATKN